MVSKASRAVIEDDPVIAEYDVFITPPNHAHQLYVLQYPERPRGHSFKRRAFPTNMRVKPSSGFVELDVPIRQLAYDKVRGLRWGEALKEAKDDGVKSFGISAGFAPVYKPKNRAPHVQRTADDASLANDNNGVADDIVEADGGKSYSAISSDEYDQAKKDGRVLDHQTLGGQVVAQEVGRPLYMVASFNGPQCHMTPSTGVVQMRPQFHYLDAQVRLEQIAKRKSMAESFPTAEPQAIFDRAKAADGAEDANHLQTLQKARSEQWTDLSYHNEDANDSYYEFYESLFARDAAKEAAVVSTISNESYLDIVSAPRSDVNGRLKRRPSSKRQPKSGNDLSEDSDIPDEPDV